VKHLSRHLRGGVGERIGDDGVERHVWFAFEAV
jgi:hypothetical protein